MRPGLEPVGPPPPAGAREPDLVETPASGLGDFSVKRAASAVAGREHSFFVHGCCRDED